MTVNDNDTPVNWQQQMHDAVDNNEQLLRHLKPDSVAAPLAADSGFALKVPQAWLRRVRTGANDPLLRQILPLAEENISRTGFDRDPVGEAMASVNAGIIRKYRHRVLLITTAVCAIHCRYCFRRHFPYRENSISRHLDAAIAAIANDSGIEEVILSGGDPLSLSNPKLFELCRRLETIAHVQRLRIHSRLPIAIPDRIDDTFVRWTKERPKPYVLVLHINHPNEIDDSVKRAVMRLRHWPLLNQAVLLRSVNDDRESLIGLSLRCFDAGVMPYYLHLLDRVAGSAHFEVKAATARRLMREISAELPGYLVPKLVRESAGEAAKSIIAY